MKLLNSIPKMDLVKKIMAPDVSSHSNDEGTLFSSKLTPNLFSSKQMSSNQPRKNSSANNAQVNLLRKEIEEMKFYQELEQTEYQEMKEKMHNYDKQMKDMEKMKKEAIVIQKNRQLQMIDESSELDSNIDTVDLMSSSPPSKSRKVPDGDVTDRILHKKLIKRDSQIQLLKTKLHEKVTTSKESSGKLKSLAKEYEKRLNRMESLKDEEIEEIKDHYKSMMETLAKQAQKSGNRYNDEVQKNAQMRSILEEMKADMAKREKNLEKKIKLQHESIKMNEIRLNRTESKLDRSGNKYTSLRNDLEEALKLNQEYCNQLKTAENEVTRLEETHAAIVKDLEEKFESEMKEFQEKSNNDFDDIKSSYDRENTALQLSVEEEITALTGKLFDMENMFDEEAREHDKTSARVQELDDALKEKEDEVSGLKEQINNHETDEVIEQTWRKEENKLKDMFSGLEIRYSNAITEMELLKEDKLKKKDFVKKQSDVIDKLKSQLNIVKDANRKELKHKDIEFVKARKKWSLNEHRLLSEINELTEAVKSKTGAIIVEGCKEDEQTIISQRTLIKQLKAEKSSLQMKIASMQGRADMQGNTDKRVKVPKKSLTAYERTLDLKFSKEDAEHEYEDQDERHQGNVIGGISTSERRDEGEVKTSENLQNHNPIVESQNSEMSSSMESTKMLVTDSKKQVIVDQQKSGMTSQKSYRNFVKDRRFSKRNKLLSVQNE